MPEFVVLHYTAMTPAAAAIARLCDPAFEVSAHYVISEAGEVTQLVAEVRRAWHAGAGSWRGRDDMNSRSIGIELVNDGASPFAEPLLSALQPCLAGILARWSIPPWNVIGHSDMAPGRKIDPGRSFPWTRLEDKELALGPYALARVELDELPPCETLFRADALAAGYPDGPCETLLEAFRSRFAPQRSGPLSRRDMGDIARLRTLMETFDKDRPQA
ncbi:MAG: N-acetylmuramoyl-L-alanine amidase [Pseudomonadota bacterium]